MIFNNNDNNKQFNKYRKDNKNQKQKKYFKNKLNYRDYELTDAKINLSNSNLETIRTSVSSAMNTFSLAVVPFVIFEVLNTNLICSR